MNRNLEALHLKPTSAGVLLVAKHHILFVKEKSSDKWGLPKGSIQKDESKVDCWKRELKEETQIDIDLYKYRVIWNKRINRYIIYTVILSIDNETFNKMKTQESKSEEINQVEWIKIGEIPTNVYDSLNSTAWTAIFSINHPSSRSFRRE